VLFHQPEIIRAKLILFDWAFMPSEQQNRIEDMLLECQRAEAEVQHYQWQIDVIEKKNRAWKTVAGVSTVVFFIAGVITGVKIAR